MKDVDLYINDVCMCISLGTNKYVPHEKGWLDWIITTHSGGEGGSLITQIKLFHTEQQAWDFFIPILEQWR